MCLLSCCRSIVPVNLLAVMRRSRNLSMMHLTSSSCPCRHFTVLLPIFSVLQQTSQKLAVNSGSSPSELPASLHSTHALLLNARRRQARQENKDGGRCGRGQGTYAPTKQSATELQTNAESICMSFASCITSCRGQSLDLRLWLPLRLQSPCHIFRATVPGCTLPEHIMTACLRAEFLTTVHNKPQWQLPWHNTLHYIAGLRQQQY